MTRPLRRALAALLLACSIPAGAAVDQATAFNAAYDAFVKRYWHDTVTIHGIETTVFDYGRMSADADKSGSDFERLHRLLRQMAPPPRGDLDKAFWLNAYNFGAMSLVVANYPVDSITSFKVSWIKHPWSKSAVNVGGRDYSLSEIEKDVLLPRYTDPRLVFAVSCAAVSCPDRPPTAFRAADLDAQIDELLRRFFRNPGKGARLDRPSRSATLSWILDKDAALFEAYPGGVAGFVADHRGPESQWLREPDVRLRYLEHDWTLNDLAQADR